MSDIVEQISGGKRLLSEENSHLFRDLERAVREFCEIRTVFHGNDRYDVPAFGLSSEYALRTPIMLYDLPELLATVDTAFTDGSRTFISVPLFLEMMQNQREGKIDFSFVLAHELEHIRHLHVARGVSMDPKIANEAQDIRINIDTLTNFTTCRLYFNASSRAAYEAELNKLAQHYQDTCENHAGSVVKKGCGVKVEDRAKWGDASSEQIARVLAAEQPPVLELDMKKVFQKAAEDLREAAKQTETSNSPDASQQAAKMRELADKMDKAAGGQAKPADLKDICDQAPAMSNSDAMQKMDGEHQKQQPQGQPSSLDDLKPSSRVKVAAQAAHQLLNPPPMRAGQPQPGQGQPGQGQPGQGQPGQGQPGQVQPGQGQPGQGQPGQGQPGQGQPGQGQPGQGQPGQGQPGQGQPGQGQPGQGGLGTLKHQAERNRPADIDTHYIPPENLKEILDRANAQNLSKALGYDTPEKIEKMKQDTASNIEGAIRKAAEDMRRAGGSYPGAHMVNSAMQELNVKHHRPVLALDKLRAALSQHSGKRKTNYDLMTPSWMVSVNPGDMGFASAADMPFIGSQRPVKPKRQLILALVDTSGSTGNVLDQLVGEAINLSRTSRRIETAPEVIFMSADTVVRGKPMLINEGNYKQLLNNGVGVAGFGGTDFLAPLIAAMKMTERGGVFQGRTIHRVMYFTDGDCWLPPRTSLPANLPPVTFVVPESRYTLRFDRDCQAADWCEAIFFGQEEVRVNMDQRPRSGMRPQ